MEKELKQLPTQYRTARIELDSGSRAESDKRIPVALSSEEAVDRWFGREILDHDAKSVDLSRAKRGLPLLDSHDAYSSVTRQIGVIEEVRVDNDRVIRGLMRFSQRPDAQAIRQDVLDGIISSVSIGYRIDELVLEKSDKKQGETYRATKWRLLEGSLVSVPADATVGVGRSATGNEWPLTVRAEDEDAATCPECGAEMVDGVCPTCGDSAAGGGEEAERAERGIARNKSSHNTTAPKGQKEHTVENTNTAATNGAATVGADRSADYQRTEELTALAQIMKRDDNLGEWIRSGKPVETIKTELLAEANRNLDLVRSPAVDLTEKEKKNYSLMRAVAAEITKDWSKAGFEREVSDTIAQRLPAGYQRRGNFFMPGNVGTRTALSVDGSGTGAETVFDEPGSFIEMLRNRMKVKELGATMLSGLRGPVAFPKQSGAGSTQWLGESSTVTESNLSTQQVLLNPKTLRARQSYTKQLFLEGVVDAENLIRSDLASVMALAIDLAAINGSGGANEPTGILQTSGIGSVAVGTNGGAPTYSLIVDLETEIAQDNADISAMAYLTTAVMRGKLKKVEQFATTNGQPVWTGGREGEVNGYAAHVSNQVPSTLTKGSSTDCHAIIFGAWNQLMIGEWGALEIQVDPYTRADYGEVVLRTFQMVGLAVRYAEAFAAIKDARNV